jgi:hypothetical protein
MSLTQVQTRHEFLFRWDDHGNRQGAHIAYREAIVDSATGTEIASKFLDPQPVSLANGTDLADIAAAINVATLADCEAKAAQIDALNAAAAAATTAHAGEVAALNQAAQAAANAHEAALAATDSARDAALAQVADLQAQLAALQPSTVNGIPQEVTMRQAQLALLGAGLLQHVNDAIAAIPGPAGDAARITWEKSSAVRRDNALIAQLAVALGLTGPQIDALFVTASML